MKHDISIQIERSRGELGDELQYSGYHHNIYAYAEQLVSVFYITSIRARLVSSWAFVL